MIPIIELYLINKQTLVYLWSVRHFVIHVECIMTDKQSPYKSMEFIGVKLTLNTFDDLAERRKGILQWFLVYWPWQTWNNTMSNNVNFKIFLAKLVWRERERGTCNKEFIVGGRRWIWGRVKRRIITAPIWRRGMERD